MRRRLILLLLVVSLLAACDRQVTEVTATTAASIDTTATTVPADQSSTTVTTIGGADSTTTNVAPTTTVPGEAVTSTSSTFPEEATTTTAPPNELVVMPYGTIGGVELGTDLDTALPRLTSVFGEPDDDTGWQVGCPLDGEDENERIIRWGSLSTHFYLVDTGRLIAWTIDGEDGDIPGTEVRLPGGSTFGEPMSAVAAANGLEVLLDGVFGAATVSQDGYVLWGFPDELSAPLSLVGVPYVPVCE